jgi:hypothetical protein
MAFATLNASTGIPLAYANRHGLVTGPTGTGKSVTLMRLAEQFCRAGTPVLLADVKGDLAALQRSCTVNLLDLYGEQGRQISVPLSAMGADLVSRALELSDAQAGAVEAAFGLWAHGYCDLDTIDEMRGALRYLQITQTPHAWKPSAASNGVVLRALARIEKQAGPHFFACPPYDVAQLLDGQVTILAASRLINAPRLYGAFLLFLLSDLYDRLPEVGDLPKPRLVMFFDEAHLLFQDCPAPLLRKIEQTVRLIRSKGVGVYFVTQSPNDVPALIRSQLAHTIEHDRALPVGVARVGTMDSAGRPLKPVTVRIDLPSCPLGAPIRQPPTPVQARQVQKPRGAAYALGHSVAPLLLAGMLASGAIVVGQFVTVGTPSLAPFLAMGLCAAILAKMQH